MPLDLSHHINAKSKARHPSPLKDIIKFMGQDGMISLAGGLPHPSLFPLQKANFVCDAPPTSLAPNDGLDSTSFTDLVIGRSPDPGHLELTQFLQYGSGKGNDKLIQWCKALTEQVHAPPAAFDCILHPGNTNAWAKVVGLLCEDDDFIIVEEYTYPSAQAYTIPLGIKAVPIAADAEGIQADLLEDMLASWDETERGARRPTVLYLVSVGSNPTGITISAPRRREIYDVCKKFDIIIVEDDPYYFLQYPHYQQNQTTPPASLQPTPQFLQELTPSFLSRDTEGRVIRLDSFSKTIFPGLRLGYFIANPIFIERLLRATEVETQDPAGLSQAFVTGLLDRWGMEGYFNWLQHLKKQYEQRRNWLLDAFNKNFTLLPAAESPLPSAQGLVVCLPSPNTGTLRPVFSFIDPSAGMFVWSKFYFDGIPRFHELEGQKDVEDPEQTFAHELWMEMAEALVLLTPGSYYHPWQGPENLTTKARGAEPRTAAFRFSFATPTESQIHEGIVRLRTVVAKHWGL